MTSVQAPPPAAPKTHTSLSPRTNLLLIFVWAAIVVGGFVFVQPRLPLALGIVGGVLGVLAGLMQHLSIKHDPAGFIAASSWMGVRRALSGTSWGRRYIWWLYFSKFVLAVISILLVKSPLSRVVAGYLVAYFSLMFCRDAIKLRDTHSLASGSNESSSPPMVA